MDSKRLSRRHFVASCAAVATGLMVAACAPKVVEKVVKETVEVEKIVKETVIVAPEVIEIRFEDESGAGPAGYDVFTEILSDFEEEHPTIRVNFEPCVGDWVQKVTAQMAAGNAPDVTVAYGGFARHWMETGQLLPLEEVFMADYLADFYEQQLKAFRIGPHLYEIPKYVASIVVAYNKELFDEAGLPYPEDSWTVDDFVQAAEKLTVRDASGKVTQWGYHVAPYSSLAAWVWKNGGEWMDKDVLGTKMLLDQPKSLEALRIQHDMMWKDGLSPMPADIDGKGAWATLPTGKVAMAESANWQVTVFMESNPFAWDYAVLPKGPVGYVAQTWADGYGIYAGTKYPEASREFLRYITSPGVEIVQCTSVLTLQPSRKSVEPIWNTDSAGAKAGYNVQAYTQQMPQARLDPYFVDNAKVKELYGPLWDKVWVSGTLDLEEGIKEMCKRVNEHLASVTL